jgi:thiamine biosynthesis lipoprotein
LTRNYCPFLSSYRPKFTAPLIAAAALLFFPLSRATVRSPAEPVLQRFEYSLPRMGTLFRIVLYAPNSDQATSAAMAAFERVEELEQMMSDYREDSELNFLCREAWKAPQKVSRELFFVLEKAQHLSEISGGSFDVTIGPVVSLWRGARRSKRLPSATEIARAKAAVGYKNVVLDAGAQTVLLKRKDMKLDLGGIAKGYAADEALILLRTRGITRALADAGGDLALGDSPPDKPGWQITIRETEPKGIEPSRYVILHNAGVATSGDVFQFIESGGVRYSHIINPGNGLGTSDSASTTVIAPDGITADALATTCSILPVKEAMRIVESLKGVSARLVRRLDGETKNYTSQSFPKVIDAGQR